MASSDKEAASKSVRKRIQNAMEQAELERKHELMKRRITLATEGLRSFQSRKVQDAVICFRSYLKILEEMKGVSEGGLNPSLFDRQKDLAELLLISGVYWDLVKLYDRTKSSEKRKDFLQYMEKFILFSRGMPFQVVCAETLRKYIQAKRPVHMDDFKNAYKMLGESKCFVASALVDEIDIETMPRLRRYRDEFLLTRGWGRAFVHAYYAAGPWVAAGVERLPRTLRRMLARGLNKVSQKVEE